MTLIVVSERIQRNATFSFWGIPFRNIYIYIYMHIYMYINIHIYIYIYIYGTPPPKKKKESIYSALSPKPASARTHTFQAHCLNLSKASHLAANAATKYYVCVRASLQGSALETEKTETTEKKTERNKTPRIQGDMGPPPRHVPLNPWFFTFFSVFFSGFS